MKVTIEKLDSGYVVSKQKRNEWGHIDGWHRTAEPTFTGAFGLAARAFDYRGTIEFSGVADVALLTPEQAQANIEKQWAALKGRVDALNARAAEVPVFSEPSEYAPPGVAFDPEEPNLRAGTAVGDKL